MRIAERQGGVWPFLRVESMVLALAALTSAIPVALPSFFNR
jgi:hypothetical protein